MADTAEGNANNEEPPLFETPLEAPCAYFDLTTDDAATVQQGGADADFFDRPHPLHEHVNGPPKLKPLLSEEEIACSSEPSEPPLLLLATVTEGKGSKPGASTSIPGSASSDAPPPPPPPPPQETTPSATSAARQTASKSRRSIIITSSSGNAGPSASTATANEPGSGHGAGGY